MRKKEYYHTKQKELVLNIIQEQTKEFTVQEIYQKLNNCVGLTTIYRIIDRLVDQKIINKYIGKDNITYYQYLKECLEKNHFYLKCDNCKEFFHIDCDCIEELSDHIKKQHQFQLNQENIVIHGICKNCRKKEVK